MGTDGSMISTIEHPEKKVEVSVEGKPTIIGTQPPYKVANIIPKEKIALLKKYLEDQYDGLSKRQKAAEEVIEEFATIKEADKIAAAIKLIPRDSKDFRKLAHTLKHVDELARKIDMKISAVKNKELLDNGLARIEEQLKFINTQLSLQKGDNAPSATFI